MKKILVSFAFMLLAISFVKADIPPPSGYTRVRIPLVFETKEDLSKYRLFVSFSGIYEEVTVNEKGKTTFTTNGSGARFAGGTLIAIPKTEIAQFGAELTYEQQQELGNLLREKKIEGVIELGSHTFTTDSQKGKKVPTPLYVIKKGNDGLKLLPKTSSKSKKKLALSENGTDEIELAENETEDSRMLNNTAVAGFFLASSMFLGGMFFLRRKKR